MTATRDRDSDLDSDTPEVEWDDRPAFGSFRGLPWWAAVLLALALSAIGAFFDRARLVDDERLTSLGVYQVAFLAGCVLAVLLVRRRNLFGPMVQPPLIFAVTFVPIQLTSRTSTGTDTGVKKLIFEVGLPLASSFPWMAGATVATIVLGVVRLLTQRDPDARSGRLDAEDDDRASRREPGRRPSRDREDRPARGSRGDRERPSGDDRADRGERRSRDDRAAREDRPSRDSRGSRDDRRPREDRAAPQVRRREQGSPQRRPPRDRDERSDRDRGDRGDRGSRSEAPPRRNPPRPREQGGKPRPQQRRRPREDDYLD